MRGLRVTLSALNCRMRLSRSDPPLTGDALPLIFALVYGSGIFVQWLEGPRDLVMRPGDATW